MEVCKNSLGGSGAVCLLHLQVHEVEKSEKTVVNDAVVSRFQARLRTCFDASLLKVE